MNATSDRALLDDIKALGERSDRHLERVDILIAEGLPIPVMSCAYCEGATGEGGTVYRLGARFQCPSCGGRDTFPHLSSDGAPFNDLDWIAACARSDARMAELSASGATTA
jgi:hypothetical protein